jgi:hypothetical protein
MKRFITYSGLALLVAVIFTACIQQRDDIDESYWLNQERATVVYSSPSCSYYVVETYEGYTILRAWGGYKPYEGSVVYGRFSNYGARDFYNRSNGMVFSAEVIEYWLTYSEAQSAAEYYCY